MKKKIKILSYAYFTFLLMLLLSGLFSGILSEAVYYLAFLLPFGFAVYFGDDEKNIDHGCFTLSEGRLKLTLPLIAPSILAVMIISFLTSFVIFAVTGVENSVDVGNSILPALILHALVPAILEELIFRYLPMRLLSPHSPLCAVLASAFFFALVHHNLFSIPYALAAGLIFMAIDLAFDSVLPSMIIHFLNNMLSVCLIVFADNKLLAPIAFTVITVLCILSVSLIIINRKIYCERFSCVIKRGEGLMITKEMLLFLLLTLSLSVIGFN